MHGGAAAFAQLSAIPDVRTARIVTPRVMQLTLRAPAAGTRGSPSAQSDPGPARRRPAGRGRAPVATTPSPWRRRRCGPRPIPGYVPTAPPALGEERALGLLAEAGYQVDARDESPSPPPSPGRRPLPDRDHPRTDQQGRRAAVARDRRGGQRPDVDRGRQHRGRSAAQRRHRRDRCSALDPPVLYGDALANNRVDAIVGWHQAGGDLATALASRYGCPALEATPVSTTTPATRRRRRHRRRATTPPRRAPTPTTTAPARPRPRNPAQLVQAPTQPHRHLRPQHPAEDRRRARRHRDIDA